MHDDLSGLKSAEWPMQIFHWFSYPITMSLHLRFTFNIQSWLSLKNFILTLMHDDLSALKSAERLMKCSIGLVSLSPCHCILGLDSTCKYGYVEDIYAWTLMHDDLSALRSAEWLMQILHWLSFPITMSLHPWFSFNMHVWLCLIHLCMDIHV